MRAMWAVVALTMVAGIASWAAAVPAVEAPTARQLPVAREFTPPDRAAIATGATRLRDRNPFRQSRAPAPARYNPWEPVASPQSPTPARPVLSLAGILGGPPWNAVIEGIPGKESGIVLRVGETSNGFQLVSIRGDTVRIAGQDTTWTLTPKPAWP